MKKNCILLVALLIGNLVNAQWQQTSLGGIKVNSFTISETNFFAATDVGVFLSTNNGNSWTAVNTGLENLIITSIDQCGTNIFAGIGAGSGGLFVSSNNGTNWTVIDYFSTGHYIYALAVTDTIIFTGGTGGVYLSTDNGQNWDRVISDKIINVLAVADTILFAGDHFYGLFLSTDNGSGWTEVNTGLTNKYILSIAINDANVFVGTYGGGVYLSDNYGANWTAMNTGLTSLDIASLAISGMNIFAGTNNGAGIFMSTNNGNNWTSVNTGLSETALYVYSFAIAGDTIFAGTSDGVWKHSLSNFTATGNNDICETNSIMVYPNPATNILNIETNSQMKGYCVSIYTLQGQLLVLQALEQTKTEVDISDLAKGIYSIKLSDDDKSVMKRFVKE